MRNAFQVIPPVASAVAPGRSDQELLHLLRGSSVLEQAVAEHRERANARRRELLVELKDNAVSQQLYRAACAATAHVETTRRAVDRARDALTPAIVAYASAQANCIATGYAYEQHEGVRRRELEDLADPRIQAMIAWIDRIGERVRNEFQVNTSLDRNWLTKIAVVITDSNAEPITAALVKLATLREQLVEMKHSDYGDDPRAQLQQIHAAAQEAIRPMGLRAVPDLQLDI